MSGVTIVPVCAAALAILFVALSVRTLRLRRALGVPIGDGGDASMLRAIRVHANFAEYVPLSLLLLFFAEAGGAPAWLVHALCACLLLGRAAHALGVSQARENYRYRVLGMGLTFTVLLTASGYLAFAPALALLENALAG